MKFTKDGYVEKRADEILERYQELYPGPTPITCPWLFSPINPPEGWRWDYEHEYWINEKQGI